MAGRLDRNGCPPICRCQHRELAASARMVGNFDLADVAGRGYLGYLFANIAKQLAVDPGCGASSCDCCVVCGDCAVDIGARRSKILAATELDSLGM
jgi:hypothetical protein